MATLTFNGESYTVDHAVKGTDYVHGYDADGSLVVSIDGIVDFDAITYDDTYMEPASCAEENCNDAIYVDSTLKTRGGVSVPPNSHTHAASSISAGTFKATGVKAMTGTDYSTARVRNIYAGTSDMTAGTTELASGNIYLVYE